MLNTPNEHLEQSYIWIGEVVFPMEVNCDQLAEHKVRNFGYGYGKYFKLSHKCCLKI